MNFSISFIELLRNCDTPVAHELLNCRWSESSHLIKEGAPDYITFREKDSLISFCPFGKEQLFTENGDWKREGRQSAKPGKVVRMILKQDFPDVEIEKFVNCFKAYECKTKVFFKTVTPAEAYDSSNYAVNIDSCMKNKGFTAFYPNTVQSLVAYNADGYVGRALLWNEVKGPYPNIKVMDRIYGSDEIIQMFKNWAKENGYFRKEYQTYSSKQSFIDPDGLNVSLMLTVNHPTQSEYEDEFPYMDTFTFGNGIELNNFGFDNSEQYTYNCTDGCRDCPPEEDQHEGEIQLHNGDWVSEDNACMIGGDYYDIDDCVTCHRTDEWILLEDAYRIELSRRETIFIHRDFVTAPSN